MACAKRGKDGDLLHSRRLGNRTPKAWLWTGCCIAGKLAVKIGAQWGTWSVSSKFELLKSYQFSNLHNGSLRECLHPSSFGSSRGCSHASRARLTAALMLLRKSVCYARVCACIQGANSWDEMFTVDGSNEHTRASEGRTPNTRDTERESRQVPRELMEIPWILLHGWFGPFQCLRPLSCFSEVLPRLIHPFGFACLVFNCM